jgi:DHA2 family multidrug resistance protein
MFPMLEIIIPIMFILSPTGEKGRFYSIFYPIAIGSSNIMGYYLTSYAFDHGITNAYYIYIISMLALAALSLVFQHNKRFGFKLPLYQIDWISLGCLGLSMMSLNYALSFMKQQNWFNEPTLKWSVLLAILLFVYVIFRQSYQKRKLIDFSAFLKFPSVQHSIVILLFQALYLSSSSVFMQWSMGVLGYNALISAKLNLWMLPGLIIGGIIGFQSFKKNWNIKYYILMGFGAFFVHTLLIYLFIQPNMNIEMLIIPTILKGVGMVILFIGVWFYASKDLPMSSSLGVIALLMSFRTFVTLGITGGILGYFSTQFQAQSMHDLSNFWDSNLMGPGAMQAYGMMQINTMLAAGKTLLGYCLWLILPISAIILLHDYGRPNNRRRVLIKKRVKGHNLRGYRYKSNEI